MPDRDVLSDRWKLAVGVDGADTWALEPFDDGADLPDQYRIVEVVPVAELDRLRAENGRLRRAIELHRSVEYGEMPGDCDQDFLVALASIDATLYSALSFDDQNVAGVPATSEITGRSWDAKAAGRRAVDKHADALKRLSDEGEVPRG